MKLAERQLHRRLNKHQMTDGHSRINNIEYYQTLQNMWLIMEPINIMIRFAKLNALTTRVMNMLKAHNIQTRLNNVQSVQHNGNTWIIHQCRPSNYVWAWLQRTTHIQTTDRIFNTFRMCRPAPASLYIDPFPGTFICANMFESIRRYNIHENTHTCIFCKNIKHVNNVWITHLSSFKYVFKHWCCYSYVFKHTTHQTILNAVKRSTNQQFIVCRIYHRSQ